MRTTSLVARATAASSSPTMSPSSTILGRPEPPGQRALALGGVAHGLEVAVVHVLQAGEQHRRRGRLQLGEQVVLDLDDAGHGVLGVAEELQAHRAHMCGHAVHDPARAGDQAVAAFLLDAGQAGQELVGDVLAQAFLAEHAAGDVQTSRCVPASCRWRRSTCSSKRASVHVVDLAQVVVQARHLQPLGVGRDHAPAGQVVQRGAPQHGLLAAGVHGDVAAHAAGFGRGGVDGEDVAGALGGVGHALRDDAGFGVDGGHGFGHAGQAHATRPRSWPRASRC
jgi:hypothetical protein